MKNYKKLAFLFLLSTLSAFAQGNKPLKGLNIMLDPGHGGADPGAIGQLGLKESDTNLRVARYLRMLLEYDGAKVSMTRDRKETHLSLASRIAMSNKAMPDLFISIHHNASLSPKKNNQTEIYYDAKDRGVSKLLGMCISDSFAKADFAGKSVLIPAGFQVLRNNQAPSVLTEGSYISIPESERNLRSGKGLTKEAEIIWKSIRKAYAKGALDINLYSDSKNVLILDSPYFNLLFSANKAISTVSARLDDVSNVNIGIKSVMAYPMTYSLYNTNPLKSGKYEMTLSGTSYDGMPSPQKRVKFEVALPINRIEIKPVAPYIPLGFKGRFPVTIKLYDGQNNINSRSVITSIEYGKNSSEFLSDPSGITTIFLELKGNETKEINLELSVENKKVEKCKIPIAMPIQRFVLGRLTGFNNQPISNAAIRHKGKTIATTTQAGLFYFYYPLNIDEYKIEVQPSLGYKSFSKTLTTGGEPVILPQLQAEAVSPALLNQKIAIMATKELTDMVRSLIKPLAYAGAKLTNLNMPEQLSRPEYQAVLEANLIKDLKLVISLKTDNVDRVEIRHYHSSKNGKKLAEAVKSTFKESYPNIAVKSCAGSDYELGHTGATAIVIAIPSKPNEKMREALISQLSKTLSSNK